ncbi:hypothetical protein K2F40_12995 [Clostridium sp. CM028]|nr:MULTISPECIES: hypothetical protein [unclassified Clostridium]MBU3092373.1 hypothetical protein [Clostridium sp. CF011]MBW9146009.1 hypothetical protein [Clostridium sp. CM027]MBW9149875.1 hypothetical protein [Clostridium sp. CM028]UVE39479.1 hypothetical protein KTC92_09455 [Clostridium sp. CM027]WLC63210.1 hypothetical protein KTC94_08185 [Clostridium sp. CM028]
MAGMEGDLGWMGMKLDKEYYVIVSIIVFVCGLIISTYNLYNFTGFLIILLPSTIFNVSWHWYHNDKGE